MPIYKVKCKIATLQQWEEIPKNDLYVECWQDPLLSPLADYFSGSAEECIEEAISLLIQKNRGYRKSEFDAKEKALLFYSVDGHTIEKIFYDFVAEPPVFLASDR